MKWAAAESNKRAHSKLALAELDARVLQLVVRDLSQPFLGICV